MQFPGVRNFLRRERMEVAVKTVKFGLCKTEDAYTKSEAASHAKMNVVSVLGY